MAKAQREAKAQAAVQLAALKARLVEEELAARKGEMEAAATKQVDGLLATAQKKAAEASRFLYFGSATAGIVELVDGMLLARDTLTSTQLGLSAAEAREIIAYSQALLKRNAASFVRALAAVSQQGNIAKIDALSKSALQTLVGGNDFGRSEFIQMMALCSLALVIAVSEPQRVEEIAEESKAKRAAAAAAAARSAPTATTATAEAMAPASVSAPSLTSSEVLSSVALVASDLLTSDLHSTLMGAVERAVASALRVPTFRQLGHGSLRDMLQDLASAGDDGSDDEEGSEDFSKAYSVGVPSVDAVLATPSIPLKDVLAALANASNSGFSDGTNVFSLSHLAVPGAGSSVLAYGPPKPITLGDAAALAGALPSSVGAGAWDECVRIVRALKEAGLVGSGSSSTTKAQGELLSSVLRKHFRLSAGGPSDVVTEAQLEQLLSAAATGENAAGGSLSVRPAVALAPAAAASSSYSFGLKLSTSSSSLESPLPSSSITPPAAALSRVPLLGSVEEHVHWMALYQQQHGPLDVYLVSSDGAGACARTGGGLRFIETSRGSFMRVADAADATWANAMQALRRGHPAITAALLSSMLAFEPDTAALHLPAMRQVFLSLLPAGGMSPSDDGADAASATAAGAGDESLLLVLRTLQHMPACVRDSFAAAVVVPALLQSGANLRRLPAVVDRADALASTAAAGVGAVNGVKSTLLGAVLAVLQLSPPAESSSSGRATASSIIIGSGINSDQRTALCALAAAILLQAGADMSGSADSSLPAGVVSVSATPSTLQVHDVAAPECEGRSNEATASGAEVDMGENIATSVAVADSDHAKESATAAVEPEVPMATEAPIEEGEAAAADKGDVDDNAASLLAELDHNRPFPSLATARAFIRSLHNDYLQTKQQDDEASTPLAGLATPSSLSSGAGSSVRRSHRFLHVAIQATERLSAPLYQEASHFLYELIQNADDNRYALADGQLPTLSFSLLPPADRVSLDTDSTGYGAPTTTSDASPSVNTLVVRNNEVGFSPSNLYSLCGTGQSSKTAGGTIGKKGVGFKSVYSATDRVLVHSGYAHFVFDRRPPPAGLGGAGMLVPQWLDPTSAGVQPRLAGTQMLLPLQSSTAAAAARMGRGDLKISRNKLIDGLTGIASHPEMMLFMQRLRRLEMRIDSSADEMGYALAPVTASSGIDAAAVEVTTLLTRHPDVVLEAASADLCSASGGLVAASSTALATIQTDTSVRRAGGSGPSASASSKSNNWLMCTSAADIISAPHRTVPLAKEDGRTTDVNLAFPLHAAELFSRAASTVSTAAVAVPALPSQRLYAFLPVADYGLRFVLQADWLVATSRERVLEDDEFNVWLAQSVIPRAYAASFNSFATYFARQHAQAAASREDSSSSDDVVAHNLAVARAFLSFLPLPSHVQPSRSKLFQLCADATLALVQQLPCLPTEDGRWVAPVDAVRSASNTAIAPSSGGKPTAAAAVPSLQSKLAACNISPADVAASTGMQLVHPSLVLPEEIWTVLNVRQWDLATAAQVLTSAHSDEAVRSSDGASVASRFVACCDLIRYTLPSLDRLQLSRYLRSVAMFPVAATGGLTSLQATPTLGYIDTSSTDATASAAAAAAESMVRTLGNAASQPLLAPGVVAAFREHLWLPQFLSQLGVEAATVDTIVTRSVIPLLTACTAVVFSDGTSQANATSQGSDTVLTASTVIACTSALCTWYNAKLTSSGGRLSSEDDRVFSSAKAALIFITADWRAMRLQPPADVDNAIRQYRSQDWTSTPSASASGVGIIAVTSVPFLHRPVSELTLVNPAARAAATSLACCLGPALWPVLNAHYASAAHQTGAAAGSHTPLSVEEWSRFWSALHISPWLDGLMSDPLAAVAGAAAPAAPKKKQLAFAPSQATYALSGTTGRPHAAPSSTSGAIELEALLRSLTSLHNASPSAASSARAPLLSLYEALVTCLEPSRLEQQPRLRSVLCDTAWVPEGFNQRVSSSGATLYHPRHLLAPLPACMNCIGNRGRYLPRLSPTLIERMGGPAAADAAITRLAQALGSPTEPMPDMLLALLRSLQSPDADGAAAINYPYLRLRHSSTDRDTSAVVTVVSSDPSAPTDAFQSAVAAAADGGAVLTFSSTHDEGDAASQTIDIPAVTAACSLLDGTQLVACDETVLRAIYARLSPYASSIAMPGRLPGFASFQQQAGYGAAPVDATALAAAMPPLFVPAAELTVSVHQSSNTGGTAAVGTVVRNLRLGSFTSLTPAGTSEMSGACIVADDGVNALLRPLGVYNAHSANWFASAAPELLGLLRLWDTQCGGLQHAWSVAMRRLVEGRYYDASTSTGISARSPVKPITLPPHALAAAILRALVNNETAGSAMATMLAAAAAGNLTTAGMSAAPLQLVLPVEPLVSAGSTDATGSTDVGVVAVPVPASVANAPVGGDDVLILGCDAQKLEAMRRRYSLIPAHVRARSGIDRIKVIPPVSQALNMTSDTAAATDTRAFTFLRRHVPAALDLSGSLYVLPAISDGAVFDTGFGRDQHYVWAWALHVAQRFAKEQLPELYALLSALGVGRSLRGISHKQGDGGVVVTSEGKLTVAHSLRPRPNALIVFEEPCPACMVPVTPSSSSPAAGANGVTLYVDKAALVPGTRADSTSDSSGLTSDAPSSSASYDQWAPVTAMLDYLEEQLRLAAAAAAAATGQAGAAMDPSTGIRVIRGRVSKLLRAIKLDASPSALVDGMAPPPLDASLPLDEPWYEPSDLELPRARELAELAAQAAERAAALASYNSSGVGVAADSDGGDADSAAALLSSLSAIGEAEQARIAAIRERARASAAQRPKDDAASTTNCMPSVDGLVTSRPLPPSDDAPRGGGASSASAGARSGASAYVEGSSVSGSDSDAVPVSQGQPPSDHSGRAQREGGEQMGTNDNSNGSVPRATSDVSGSDHCAEFPGPRGDGDAGSNGRKAMVSVVSEVPSATQGAGADREPPAGSGVVLLTGAADLAASAARPRSASASGAGGHATFGAFNPSVAAAGALEASSSPAGAAAFSVDIDSETYEALKSAYDVVTDTGKRPTGSGSTSSGSSSNSSSAENDAAVRPSSNSAGAAALGRLGELLAFTQLQSTLSNSEDNLAATWLNEGLEAGLPFDMVVAPLGSANPLETAVRFIEVKTSAKPLAETSFLVSTAEAGMAHRLRDAYELWLVNLQPPSGSGAKPTASITTIRGPSALINRRHGHRYDADDVGGTVTLPGGSRGGLYMYLRVEQLQR